MKATELMIGDKVAIRSNDGCDLHVMTVSEVKNEGISSGKQKVFFAYDEIEPIPLTAEILEKNGFEVRYNPSPYYSLNNRFKIEKDFLKGGYVIEVITKWVDIPLCKIKI